MVKPEPFNTMPTPKQLLDDRYCNALLRIDALQHDEPELTVALLELTIDLVRERREAALRYGPQADKPLSEWIRVVLGEVLQFEAAVNSNNTAEMLRQSTHVGSTAVHLMEATRKKLFPPQDQISLGLANTERGA